MQTRLVSMGLGALALALAAGAAGSQTPSDPRLATYKANDKNKDGKLAKDEFRVVARSYGFAAAADEVWSQADKNKDNFLHEVEFLAALEAGAKSTTQVVSAAPPSAGALGTGALGTDALGTDALGAAPPAAQVLINFHAYDKTKDGKLARDEYQALTRAFNLLSQADTLWGSVNADKDAFLTEQELIAQLRTMQGVRIVTGGSAAGLLAGGAQAGGVQMMVSPATDAQRMAAFKSGDKNNDGRLTKAEYGEVLKSLGLPDQVEIMWPLRDANRDDFLSEAEFKTPGGAPIIIQQRQ